MKKHPALDLSTCVRCSQPQRDWHGEKIMEGCWYELISPGLPAGRILITDGATEWPSVKLATVRHRSSLETEKMGRKSTPQHPKVQATAAIWGCAVGMFAICIPLVAISSSGIILPLLVILGAGGGTAAVWMAPEKRQPEEIRFTQTMRALEERIMTLETICTSLSPADEPLQLTKRQDS